MRSAGRPPPPISLAQLRREAASLHHPLTRSLLMLTFTAGMVDATTYLALGHVFSANMTGNIILLGFGIAGAGGLPVLAPIVSLAGFLLGAGLGGRIDSRFTDRSDRGFRVALGLEVAVLGGAAVIAALVHLQPGHAAADLVVGLLALGMGLRNAVVRALGIPDLTTTVLTMTLTGLAASSPWAGGDGRGSARRVAAVLAMLVGALAGALLLKSSITLVLAVGAALTVGTLVGYRLTTAARPASAPNPTDDPGPAPHVTRDPGHEPNPASDPGHELRPTHDPGPTDDSER